MRAKCYPATKAKVSEGAAQNNLSALMAQMRVVQVSQPNGPFELVEREIPAPRTGSVRIKVEAYGICHAIRLPRKEPIRVFNIHELLDMRWPE